VNPLPPLPPRPPRDPGLPVIPPRPDAGPELPPLGHRRPTRDIPVLPPHVPGRAPRRRRALGPVRPGGVAVIAAILAAGGIGGIAGATLGGGDTPPPATSGTTAPTAAAAPATTPGALASAVAAAAPSVVVVRTSFGQGSGVVLSDRGLIITNDHVIQGQDRVEVITADDRQVSALVVAKDPDQDLAILRPAGPVGPGAVIADEPGGGLRVGDQVFAIGSPFGLQNTVTSGIVSYVDRPGQSGGAPMIQTDAPINPGNSGGGLFDLRGRLVGIPTSIRAPISGNVGIGFAVPSSRVTQLLERVP